MSSAKNTIPTLEDLPPPPEGKTGWPWTTQSDPLPKTQPNGEPWPEISVVTPSYNQGQFIEETIRTVLLQGYPNLEYIVIDGGSIDETTEILEKYDPWIDYWVSEPDQGQAHAINKGLRRSTGKWFNWINSDDLLSREALCEIAQHEGCQMIAGSTVNFGGSEDKKITCKNLEWKKMLLMESPVYHQPSIWVKGRKLLNIGGVREDMEYCFDYDMLIRYNYEFGEISYTEKVLAYFRVHKNSKTSSNKRLFWYEKIELWEEFERRNLSRKTKIELKNNREYHWNRMLWSRYLEVVKKSKSGKLVCIAYVFLRALQSPSHRVSRFTAGAVRQIAVST